MKRYVNFNSKTQAAVAGMALVALLLAPGAQAATCTVTSTDDAGHGSLRAAIANTTCDTIEFDLTQPAAIVLTTGELRIDRVLTIAGPGADKLTVRRDPDASNFRIFSVSTAGTVGISGVTIANGSAGAGGGIFLENGRLSVSNSTFSGNSANATGGGISLRASGALEVTITNSTFSGNTAGVEGGAIYNGSGVTLHVMNSTFTGNTAFESGGLVNRGIAYVTDSSFSENSAEGVGGGIRAAGTLTEVKNSTFSNNTTLSRGGGLYASGTLSVENSTIFGNSSSREGGGLFAFGTVNVMNSTIAGNSANQGGGILVDPGGVATLGNTIVASNTGGDCDGAVGDNGGNLTTDGTCPGTGPVDPMLLPLDYNGGPTRTMALEAGSPAIDMAVLENCPATDQRGVSRPQGSGCDIGAFELVRRSDPVFSGFFAPVSNAPTVNVAKAGQAIPVKFSLGGDWGLSIIASGYPRSQPVGCALSGDTSGVSETVTAVSSNLSYDPVTQIYTYVWKTDKAWANTCRRLEIQFSDLSHTTQTAEFMFRK